MARNVWAVANTKSINTPMLMLCANDLISSGNISLGTIQPNGPQENEKHTQYKHIKTTATMAKLFGIVL